MYQCDICGKRLEVAGSHPATHKLGGKIPWNKGGAYLSPEARANISRAQKARFQRMDIPNKGIPHTEEAKRKMSLANRGRTHSVSLEARGRIATGHKGRQRPPHVREILAECNRRRMADPAHLRKMRIGQGVKPTSIEQCFIDLCTAYNLPFRYVGNGAVWIERMNPDFINTNGKKQVVEILGSYWHNEEETQSRISRYAGYGFECIPIWDEELKDTSLVLMKLGEVHP